MDYSMPIYDRPSATREIRRFLSENQPDHQPFICILTAYTDQSYQDMAIKAGSDDFATKPITIETLKQTLLKAGFVIEWLKLNLLLAQINFLILSQ